MFIKLLRFKQHFLLFYERCLRAGVSMNETNFYLIFIDNVRLESGIRFFYREGEMQINILNNCVESTLIKNQRKCWFRDGAY